MTKAMLAKERELGEPLADVLRRLYYEQDLPLAEVGDRLGIGYTTAWFWMRRLGIPRKRLQPPPEERAS